MLKYVLVVCVSQVLVCVRVIVNVCMCVWTNEKSWVCCSGLQSFCSDWPLYPLMTDLWQITVAALKRAFNKTEGRAIWLAFRSWGELIRIHGGLREKGKKLFTGIIWGFYQVGSCLSCAKYFKLKVKTVSLMTLVRQSFVLSAQNTSSSPLSAS